jgi:hypothetical protein
MELTAPQEGLTGVAGRKDISLMTITFDLSQRKTTLL